MALRFKSSKEQFPKISLPGSGLSLSGGEWGKGWFRVLNINPATGIKRQNDAAAALLLQGLTENHHGLRQACDPGATAEGYIAGRLGQAGIRADPCSGAAVTQKCGESRMFCDVSAASANVSLTVSQRS